MRARFTAVRCLLDETVAEEFGGQLTGGSVAGCELRDRTGGQVEALVYVETRDRSTIGHVVRTARAMGAGDIRIVAVPDLDWIAAYRARAEPFAVGTTWWVDPRPGEPTPAPDGRQAVWVEPRRAFGTGTHESTRLLLLALERMNIDGRSALDLGTGSGILAIAARLRGASSVVGIDIDLAAVFVARATVRVQPQPVDVGLFAGTVDALCGTMFEIVLCNLLWERMKTLLPALRGLTSPTGVLLLSGLLAEQQSDVAQELNRQGLRILREEVLGEWLALEVGRVPGTMVDSPRKTAADCVSGPAGPARR